jgi:hypothetical protein
MGPDDQTFPPGEETFSVAIKDHDGAPAAIEDVHVITAVDRGGGDFRPVVIGGFVMPCRVRTKPKGAAPRI